MKKGLTLLAIGLVASITMIGTANADGIEYGKMCSKIKQCAMAEAKKEANFPPEMEKMFEAMFDAQCEVMLKSYTQTFEDAGLTSKAKACSDSVLEQSCEELVASEGEPNTAECKDFEKAAEAAGLDLNNPPS